MTVFKEFFVMLHPSKDYYFIGFYKLFAVVGLCDFAQYMCIVALRIIASSSLCNVLLLTDIVNFMMLQTSN